MTLPLLALITLVTRERWRDARADVKRYFVLRRTGDIRSGLLEHRRELALDLERLRRKVAEE